MRDIVKGAIIVAALLGVVAMSGCSYFYPANSGYSIKYVFVPEPDEYGQRSIDGEVYGKRLPMGRMIAEHDRFFKALRDEQFRRK